MVMNFNLVGINKKFGLILYGLEIVYRLLDYIVMCFLYFIFILNLLILKDVFNINIYVLNIILVFGFYELVIYL